MDTQKVHLMAIKQYFSFVVLLAILLKADGFHWFRQELSPLSTTKLASAGEVLKESSTSRAVKQEQVRSIFSKAANLGGIACSTVLASSIITPKKAFAKDSTVWGKVELPTTETLFDVIFDPSDLNHGWVIGAKETFLETQDGGKTWTAREFRSLEDEDINYRFEVASLANGEGWVIGKPAILLHTKDSGKQFERIALSNKLPGDPTLIASTGQNKAEMVTSQGAIYSTINGGLNWKAQVKETIDATLNRVSSSGTSGASFFSGKVVNQIRDKNGNYLAIGSRGNLFLTWSPGQDYWIPHNRGSSRRIQNMGFVQNDASKGLWMTLNGGSLLLTGDNPDLTRIDIEKLFNPSKINTGGYGIIDCAWRDDRNVWAVGGSGIIFESKDGGRTFKFNDNAKDIPGNLYRVKFFSPEVGYAIGSNGILLKYNV